MPPQPELSDENKLVRAPSRGAANIRMEPTVWQATKDLGHAIKRSMSFNRRQPKRTSPTAVEQVVAAERAAERAAAAEKAATKAAEKAEKVQKAMKATANEVEQKAVAAAAEKLASAAAEKAAAERAAAEKAAELARQKSLPGLPPRASDVRSAVGSLSAAIGRSGRRRSSVAFASDVKGANSLKPSPRQPSRIVGMVRRATKGVINEADYLSVVNGGSGDAEPGLPPRASAVARAVDLLDQTEIGDVQEAELPGPPPRASLVSRAVMRLVPRRSSDIPDLPSDVKAAEGGSRHERRQVRRMGTRAADR